MDAKILIALLIAINCYSSCGAALRRTPKVYNALITTDENLTSSRAYPVIQPTIHESGVAHYPFGPYNPYGYYSPPVVRFGQPLVPGLPTRGQAPLPYPLPQSRFPPQIMPHLPPNAAPQIVPAIAPPPEQAAPNAETMPAPSVPTPSAPSEEQQPVKPPAPLTPGQAPNFMLPPTDNPPKQMVGEKLPIPLNEFGLPPALIPIQQYPNQNRLPSNLPPYGFNQYPLLYDPITGFREQYLPPYEYHPSHHGAFPLALKPASQPQLHPSTATPVPPTTITAEETQSIDDTTNVPTSPTIASDFDSIKNASKIKNSAVPDVPPPPIPTSAKSQQS